MANANVTGFDPVGFALAGAIAITAAVHHGVRVQPVVANRTWVQPPLLWAVIVGASGSGKSAMLEQATEPFEARTDELNEAHQSTVAAWDATPAELRAQKPARPFVLVNDTTQEKLEEKLAQTRPHNVLAIHDELRTYFDAMQRYSKSSSRGTVLSMWNGRAHVVERIGRGELTIPYFGARVLGTTQIDTFTRWFAVESGDGMLPRFLPVVVRARIDHPHSEFTSEAEALDKATEAFALRLRRLFEFAPDGALVLGFDTGARQLFEQQRRRWEGIARDMSANGGESYVSVLLAKGAGHAARLALGFHMWQWAGTAAAAPARTIGAETVSHALQFVDLCISHAMVLYEAQPQGARHIRLAHAVADYVLARCEGKAEVDRRDLTQNLSVWRANSSVRAPEHQADQRAAIAYLGEMCWLLADTTQRARAGGEPTRWLLNPRIFDRFAERKEQARRVRAAIYAGWQAARAAKRG